MISYRLVRSRRKTIAVFITKDARVEVRAPLGASASVIEGFLRDRESWITAHLEQRKQELGKQTAFSVGEGDTLWYLGREYGAHLSSQCKKPYFDGEQFVLPGKDFSENKPLLVKLYKSLDKNSIDE